MKGGKKIPLQRRLILRSKAMPELRKLVRRFGRTTITNCLAKLRDEEKAQEEIKTLQAKIRQLKNKK